MSMLVVLDKEDLVRLVKGTDPHYNIMDDLDIRANGVYTGGMDDRWNWDNRALYDLTEQELWSMYRKIVDFKAK